MFYVDLFLVSCMISAGWKLFVFRKCVWEDDGWKWRARLLPGRFCQGQRICASNSECQWTYQRTPAAHKAGAFSFYGRNSSLVRVPSFSVVQTYCATLLCDVAQINDNQSLYWFFEMIVECTSSILVLMFEYDTSLRIVQTWIPYTVQGGGRRGSSVMKSAEKGIFVGLLVNIFYVNCVMPSCVFTVVIHFGSRLRFWLAHDQFVAR